jgi:hypothetical protein
MQLFIVSNEHDTRYFANNHSQHFSFNAEERFLPIYQHADEDNNKIAHLHDFADDFLEKCSLGQLISRYMVLVQSEQKILIMRPYLPAPKGRRPLRPPGLNGKDREERLQPQYLALRQYRHSRGRD